MVKKGILDLKYDYWKEVEEIPVEEIDKSTEWSRYKPWRR
jgi:hypothetical protein